MGATTIDPAEVEKFQAMAAEWWDPEGKFKPLHMLNPCRLDYITGQIAAEFDRSLCEGEPFKGLRLLDIGCGGGLVSEPMARLGASVVGADASQDTITIARIHAEQQGLTIDYRQTTAETLVDHGESFDIVLSLEVIEHVADPQAFLASCQALLAPGGLLICSTLNRTSKSYAIAIVGAEVIMEWLPRGTHDWSRFVTPNELYALMRNVGLKPLDKKGIGFNPIEWSWRLSNQDLDVNYIAAAKKPGQTI